MIAEAILVPPLLAAIVCAASASRGIHKAASALAALLQLALAGGIVRAVLDEGTLHGSGGAVEVDALSAWMILLVAFVAGGVTFFSFHYLDHEEHTRRAPPRAARWYYALLETVFFLVFASLLAANLGALWIGLEATTLANAFLVGFYRTETSIEATWKYVLISSIGITIGLFGTVLFYYSSVDALGLTKQGLDWSYLLANAARLDPAIVRLAFGLVLVGYGTKVGLAPMHTWLPDAHSQAPSPVSALLSALFINVAFYAILRYHAIARTLLGPTPDRFLIAFGLLSVAIAIPFLLVQRDYKRLLAYSSVEHMGILAIGIGFGSPLAAFGALLHMLNHAIAKSLLFFAAGNVNLRYGTRNIESVQGAATTMPITAGALLLGALAVTGAPPFGLFVSELLILIGGFQAGHALEALALLALLVTAFAAFLAHILRMTHGPPPPHIRRGEPAKLASAVLILLLLALLLLGLYIPAPARELLDAATRGSLGVA